jgi:hypothetical protein
MREIWVAIAALACGCAAHLGVSNENKADANGSNKSDASVSIDGNIDATTTAACASGRVVYLSFEGESLAAANGASDSTKNQAVWMGVGAATLPKFRNGVADRTTQIADVTNLIKQKLAAVPEIKIVTTRPPAGPYFMVGFGGNHTTVNVPYLYAVNRLDCGDTATKNDLAWVFDDAPTTQKVADFAVGSILFGLGATGTNDSNDCMCGWLTACQPSNNACTLGAGIATTGQCAGQNTEDETAILHTFCQ